ncbi:PAS domain S-box protein [Domibacillus iocasae]|uniref:Histidine kinase n=1 Tax=Domibacillus iocasae TaxID=1714016 RepID=A0A1E7DSD7_9BACI|nr:PAS domain S-box protein [Domibacillus iocasae]OES45992.1 histidine kinase [Domibacillus iocasae]
MSEHKKKDVFNFYSDDLFRQIVDNTFETTVLHADYKVVYINETGARLLGASSEELLGANVLDIFLEESKEAIRERVRCALEEQKAGELIEETIQSLNGTQYEIELYCHPFEFKGERAVLSVFRDISERKELQRQLKNKINEYSTPIVPLLDGISVIPLVGNIDEDKAGMLIENLPSQIKRYQDTRHIIVDFSGIYNIDEVVIEFLFKIEGIMKLLGISPIITGIRPELATNVVRMGRNLSNMRTESTVKKALISLQVK